MLWKKIWRNNSHLTDLNLYSNNLPVLINKKTKTFTISSSLMSTLFLPYNLAGLTLHLDFFKFYIDTPEKTNLPCRNTNNFSIFPTITIYSKTCIWANPSLTYKIHFLLYCILYILYYEEFTKLEPLLPILIYWTFIM